MSPAEPLARPPQAAPSEPEDRAAFARAPLPKSAISTMKKRRDFLACASRGRRMGLPGLMLQARRRGADEAAEAPVRVGFTASKKVGGAVRRNRAKRRLRAAAREVMPCAARPGWDYVLIGLREATADRPWPELLSDLERGLTRLHAREDEGRPEAPRRKGKRK
jgi:ribonuclease P protein component